MAGNKINTKTKGKDDKGKSNKVISQNNEDNEEVDFTLLRKPVITSITGFAQARKLFDLATEELKDLLTTECDLLYECKVCRNIFRSLVNFISHKRIYCTDKFNTSVHGHFVKSASTVQEYLKIKKTEEDYQESLKNGPEPKEPDENERIPMSKDLTEVVENIAKRASILANDDHQVTLQKIPSSSVAVFQNLDNLKNDNMRSQVTELDFILSQDNAVLNSDGKFTIVSSKELNKSDSDNVIQISDDEGDNCDELMCKICNLQFSTQKTLKFHMKYKHLESRLVYPCPDCLEIFSTSWSVFRHLFKVHRKTAAQIRRLRESIQAKAFKMNNPPAFYEKRKNNMKAPVPQKISEEDRMDQENQAWMEGMESAGVPRCGGCGRGFERRAALVAHTHTCAPRGRALRRPDKRIEIQIRKDYHKGPTGLSILKPGLADIKNNIDEPSTKLNDKVADDDKEPLDDAPMDVCEDDQNSNDSVESPEKNDDTLNFKPPIKLPHAIQAEKSNFAAFKQRILPEIDVNKLLCKKCDTTYDIPTLFEHMAGHFKWMRYACKLCNFKHYNFDQLPEHVKTVHKLKGDNDFYHSTVKAIDGTEAMIISRCLVEAEGNEETVAAETSPDSRRPSRCSSDSSRLSDDSSSSSTLKEVSTRKRKMVYQAKLIKKKKESNTDDGERRKDAPVSMEKVLNSFILGEKETSSVKNFEENSSDIDEVDDKPTKKTYSQVEERAPAASRRPVRKRTKPKNEDFEYDLSNLLKMEAQGYRDSLTVNTTTKSTQSVNSTSKTTPVNSTIKTTQSVNSTTKPIQYKKRMPQPDATGPALSLNKECCGALLTLSKKAIDIAAAHMKTSNFSVFSLQKEKSSNIFVRPMIPKILARAEKVSPRKDSLDDSASLIKLTKSTETTPTKDSKTPKSFEDAFLNNLNSTSTVDKGNNTENIEKSCEKNVQDSSETSTTNESKDNDPDVVISTDERSQQHTSIVPSVVPFKFRRQSIELMKNPIINKNITDFSKAGMKTKILVIKPINRNKDGTPVGNTSLKFQTIKLKEQKKGISSEDSNKSSDQIVLVKVPKVECSVIRPVNDVPATDSEKSLTAVNDNHVEKDDTDEVIEQTNEENESKQIVSEPEKEVDTVTDDVSMKEDRSVSNELNNQSSEVRDEDAQNEVNDA